MEQNEVRELVNKYWAGETSLQEEKLLRDFFLSATDVPEDLLPEKYLFLAFHEQSQTPVLQEDLVSKTIFPAEEKFLAKEKRIPAWKHMLKYAAIVLPLIIVFYIATTNRKTHDDLVIKETVKDKDLAVKEAETALHILATNMRDGLENARQLEMLKDLGEKLNEAQHQKNQK